MKEDSLFTKIINGDIPSHVVYQDDKTFVFMDIFPIQPGAVVVVPKTQIDHFFDLPADDYQALMTTVQMVARSMKSVFSDATRIGVIIEGFEVPHTHVKVFPISTGDDLRRMPDTSKPVDDAVLASQAKQIAALLQVH